MLAIQLGMPLRIDDIDIYAELPLPFDDEDLPVYFENKLDGHTAYAHARLHWAHSLVSGKAIVEASLKPGMYFIVEPSALTD